MVVLDLSEFEHPPEEFRHYYVLIRRTDNVHVDFGKMVEWTSALSITVYYDGGDASGFNANLIVSMLKGSVRKFVFIPITQSNLDSLKTNIDTLSTGQINAEVEIDVDHDSENNDFCVYFDKIPIKKLRLTHGDE